MYVIRDNPIRSPSERFGAVKIITTVAAAAAAVVVTDGLFFDLRPYNTYTYKTYTDGQARGIRPWLPFLLFNLSYYPATLTRFRHMPGLGTYPKN